MKRSLPALLALVAGAALVAITGPALAEIGPDQERDPSAEIAPVARPLELDEVIRTANDRFPQILAAEEDRRAAEGELLAAEGGFDPIWRSSAALVPTGAYPQQRLDTWVEQPTPLWGSSLTAGYRIGQGSIAAYDGKLATNAYGELRAGLRVPVLRDGAIDRRRASIARAALGVDVAKLSKDQLRLEITRAASQRYWDWAAAGRRVAIVEAWLKLAIDRDQGLASRVERGDIPEIDREENRRTILQRQTQLVSAERALEQAALELSLFVRDEGGAPVQPSRARLPASLPSPPSSVALALDPRRDEARASQDRPELKRFAAQQDQAKVELDLARNQRLPAIDFTVLASKDLGPGDAKRDLPVVELGLTIDVPILGRPQRGRVEAQRAAVRKIERQADLQRDRVITELRDASSALRAAATRAELASREVELADRLQAAELRRFELGDSTMLLVNLREQGAAEARVRVVDALVDFHKAAAAYRAALGELP